MTIHIGDLVEYRVRGGVTYPAEVLGRTLKGRLRIARRDTSGAIVVRAVKESNVKCVGRGVIDVAEARS